MGVGTTLAGAAARGTGNLARRGAATGIDRFNQAYRPEKWLVDQVSNVLAGHGIWQLTAVQVVPNYADSSITVYFQLARGCTLKDLEKFSGVIASSLDCSYVWDAGHQPGGFVYLTISEHPKPSYAASSTAYGDGAIPVSGVGLYHYSSDEPLAWFHEAGGFTLTPGTAELLAETYPSEDAINVLTSESELFQFFEHAGLTRTRTLDRRNPDGTAHVITVTDGPEVVLIEWLRDGLSAVFRGLPGQTLGDWKKALPVFASSLGALNGDVTEPEGGYFRVSWHNVQLQLPGFIAAPIPSAGTELTPSTAAQLYADWKIAMGEDAYGEVVTWQPRTQPHCLVLGSTGGGKSYAIRGLVTAAQIAGAAVFLGDGKGSDYAALRGQVNVQFVADTLADTVAMIALVRTEMERRVTVAAAAKIAGNPDPYAGLTPILLVLDEWATTAQRLTETFGKKGLEAVQSDLAALLRVGREPRCHVVLGTQELRTETVPGSWQENLKTVFSFGAPSEQTLRFAFNDAIRPAAVAALPQLPQGAKGRAMSVDAETGTVRVFQSYAQYSAGSIDIATAPDDAVRSAWESTAAALDQLPRLHPRLAPLIDGPSYRDAGIDELRSQQFVALDGRNGPRGDRLHLDPQHPSYVGRAVAADTAGLGFDDAEDDFVPQPVSGFDNTSFDHPPQPVQPSAAKTLDLYDLLQKGIDQ